MEMTNIEKERAFERIVPLIEKEEIAYEKVKINPILRPLAEKNNSYLINEKNIIRALKELEATQLDIKEIIDSNPDVYESTAIISKVERYKLFSSQVIHGLLLQKDELRSAIYEMLKINEIEYGIKNEELEAEFRPNIGELPKEKISPKIVVPEITYFDDKGVTIDQPKESEEFKSN